MTMIVVKTLVSLGAGVFSIQAGVVPPLNIYGWAAFATIVGVILGIFSYAGRRWDKTHNSNSGFTKAQIQTMVACLQRVDAAMAAQTTAMALIAQRQEDAHERMGEVTIGITSALRDIDKKIKAA